MKKLIHFEQQDSLGYLDLKKDGDVFGYSYEIDPQYGDFIFDISNNERVIGVDILFIGTPVFEREIEGNENIYYFNGLRDSKIPTKIHINNTSYYTEKDILFGKIKIEYTEKFILKSIAIDRSIISDPNK